MDFDDTPQEAAFRKKARAWLEKNAQLRGPDDAADELGEREDAGTIAAAKAWQAKKFDEGWAVLTWPKEYGGQGLSRVESVVWGQEEAKFKTPPNIYGIGHGMLGPTLMAHGTPEQKAKYVKEMARGQVVWCQLFSEPAAGSDLAGLRTSAVRDGSDWVINGQKIWSTGAHFSDWGMIVTRHDPNVPKHDGLTYFIVDMHAKGVEVRPIKQINGGSGFNEVFFTNVRVPDSQRLPNVKGLKGPLGCLSQARYGITWGPIGAAIASYTSALEYSKTRILFNRPLAATQAIQIRLAEMARKVTTAQLLSLQLGRLKDAGQMSPSHVSLAKWNNCRMALDISREARDILGGAGITTEHPPIRHALNLESVITYEGTETVHQLVIGRELTGINAF